MNWPLIVVGGLGVWFFNGFIGARLFWYWWNRGKIGRVGEPIPGLTMFEFGIIGGPFALIYVIRKRVHSPCQWKEEDWRKNRAIS